MTAAEKVDLKAIIATLAALSTALADVRACLMGGIKHDGSVTTGLVERVHSLEGRAKTELCMRRIVIGLLLANFIAMLFEPARAALGI